MHLDISLCTFFALWSSFHVETLLIVQARTNLYGHIEFVYDADGLYRQKNVRSKEKYEQNLQFTPTDIFSSLHLILNAFNIFHYTNALHNIDTAIHHLVSAIQTRFISVHIN